MSIRLCRRCGHDTFDHRRAEGDDPLGRLTRFPCGVAGCSCPMMVAPSDTSWRIVVAPIDETDTVETLELSSAFDYVFFEPAGGVVVETNPTGTGSFRDSRLIPWSRLLDFRKRGPES